MSYWTDRQAELREALEAAEAALKERLAKYYQTEAKDIERKIAQYYAEYGQENVIEYRTLLQRLPAADAELLIKDCEAFAEKYPEYADLIPVRESIYQLDRLEGLQQSVRLNALEAGVKLETETKAHLTTIATENLNAAAEAMGFGHNFYFNRADIVNMFVDVAWANNDRFSERIWQNVDKLVGYMNSDLAKGFARGDSYARIVEQITERFRHVSERDAYRLVYTEGTYVMNQAQLQVAKDVGFEEYIYYTAGDERVCEECQALSHEVFLLTEAQSGVNFPPMHPYCRCTHAPHVADRNAWIEKYVAEHGDRERAVRAAEAAE